MCRRRGTGRTWVRLWRRGPHTSSWEHLVPLNRHALKLLQPTATSSSTASLTKFLMNNVMPVLGGAHASRRLRTTHGFEDVPIVAISAGVSCSEHKASLAAGANGRVTKPINVETLMT